ncbi:MAG: hypothetical protein M9928_03080 [Anaerolineae bacterium]|nr:hypothetical protein [Anaerolineae bacterium]
MHLPQGVGNLYSLGKLDRTGGDGEPRPSFVIGDIGRIPSTRKRSAQHHVL